MSTSSIRDDETGFAPLVIPPAPPEQQFSREQPYQIYLSPAAWQRMENLVRDTLHTTLRTQLHEAERIRAERWAKLVDVGARWLAVAATLTVGAIIGWLLK
jgi:hypothetical protein